MVRRLLLIVGIFGLSLERVGAQTTPAVVPVAATVETTLGTASGQIRQFAFDGDPKTFFASTPSPGSADHFTLLFDKPVSVTRISVATGRPDGADTLDTGALEISVDGAAFQSAAKFVAGSARTEFRGLSLKAIRVKPGADLKHPLTIREIMIVSSPQVATFKYPIEFTVDVSDAPEMKAWADKVARICERQYPMINEELKSDGFKPRTTITMTLKKDYKGVAAASGGRITGSVKYFQANPNDVGAMVHETVHCVQNYRTRNNPGWLVEGVADWVRFFKYEPGKLGRLNPDKARYNGSYRTSAAFLNYVSEKYDKDLVRKLNETMREGEYKEEIFKALTKKTVQELDEEWRATLKR